MAGCVEGVGVGWIKVVFVLSYVMLVVALKIYMERPSGLNRVGTALFAASLALVGACEPKPNNSGVEDMRGGTRTKVGSAADLEASCNVYARVAANDVVARHWRERRIRSSAEAIDLTNSVAGRVRRECLRSGGGKSGAN